MAMASRKMSVALCKSSVELRAMARSNRLRARDESWYDLVLGCVGDLSCIELSINSTDSMMESMSREFSNLNCKMCPSVSLRYQSNVLSDGVNSSAFLA